MAKRIALIIIPIVFAMSGCTTTKMWTSKPQVGAKKNAYYEARFEPIKKDNDFFVLFRLEVQNKTNEDLKIDWNKTNYLLDRHANGLFVFEGIDTGKIKQMAIPDDVISARETFIKEISPYKMLARSPLRLKERSEGEEAIKAGILPEGENGISLVIRKNGSEIKEIITVDIEAIQDRKWF